MILYTSWQIYDVEWGDILRLWLKEIRENKGLSQRLVAKKAGISTQYYSYIENGSRCEPDKCNTEKAIANVLGFDWTLFFEENRHDDVV